MELLKGIFVDKLNVDDREPVLTFGNYGLLTPRLEFWNQLTALLVLQAVINMLFAVVIYYLIVKKRGNTSAYLAGYGVVIPCSMLVPYELIKYFGIHNRVLLMSMGIVPNVVVFRCMEAMYNTSPSAVEHSIKNYCLYYSSIVEVMYDPKSKRPCKITTEEMLNSFKHVIVQLILLSAFYSAFIPYQLVPFPTRVKPHTLDHTLSDLLDVNHLLNNIIAAFLTFFALNFGFCLVGLAINLLGFRTIQMMNNPLLESSSPSDFWSRRWNQIIQGLLKRGVFKPVRKYYSKIVAAAATFIASGLLHEYSWSIIFYDHKDKYDENGNCDTCFHPTYGKNMAFFGWNGIIMILEFLIGGYWIFRWMKNTCPKPVITLLVIMTAMPVSHLFTGDWIEGGYFSDYLVGLPIVYHLE